jgi:predicted RNA-binding Zn-ribbon protein involved in translation (DUF1610 family)
MTINEVKEHLCDLITSYANQLGETQTLETLKEAYKLIEEYDRTTSTAHWDINCNGYYPFCSACTATPKANNMSPYCPYCGAKMITREKFPRISD